MKKTATTLFALAICTVAASSAFAANPVRHEPGRSLDEGIVQALWLSPEQLHAESARHRSPLVWRVVEDFLAGRRHALDVLQLQPT